MHVKKGSLTNKLIVLMIIIFFLQILSDSLHASNENIPSLTEEFSFTPSLAFRKPWTLITSIFLHADLSHLFFNMFALFMFGNALERKIGISTYFYLFLISGIVGNIGYMITAFDPNIPGLGASGAIYGILGALAILEPGAIVFVGFYPIPLIFAALLWAVTEFLGIFAPGEIAHGAHFFGIIVGFLFGKKLRKRYGF